MRSTISGFVPPCWALRTASIPLKIDSIILEIPDPIGPHGARGMGEMPFIPFAPAVSSAVHMATGIWFDSFPLNQERILKGLGELT